MRCECGCGLEGEDDVTQWLVEEAAFLALDVFEAREQADATVDSERESRLVEMASRQLRGGR